MTGPRTTNGRDATTPAGRRRSGTRFVAMVLLVALPVLIVASPAAADPGISGTIGGPSATTFGRTVFFTGSITNNGTVMGADDFTSITIENNTAPPSIGMTVTPTILNTAADPVAPGETVQFSVWARITGVPGATAQIRLKVTGETASETVANPTNTFAGSPFTVSDAVVISATAERIQGMTQSPCQVGTCSVSIHDRLRYSVRLHNLADPTMTAVVTVSAPVPSNTSNVAAGSTIPTSDIGLVGGTSQTFVREVTVNDPPSEGPGRDVDPPQPGDIITFTASAVYDATSPAALVNEPATATGPGAGGTFGGVPSHQVSISATVFDPRLTITNHMTDTNGGQLGGGDAVVSTIEVRNTGNASATNTVVAVALTNLQNPTDVRIDGSAAPSSQVTVTGDTMAVRIGTGASGSSGGSLAPGELSVVTFTSSAVTSPSGEAPMALSNATVSFDNGGLSPKRASAQLGMVVTRLRLVKVVTNDDGGTAAPGDFTLSAAGPTPVSGTGDVENNVNPGTYTLSETNLPGYTASAWECTGGGSLSGDAITLAAGDMATCRITNDDVRPRLTLVKHVVNDHGRTNTSADFTLSAAGETPISGAGGVSGEVLPGTYTLSETNLPGYTASGWVCNGSGTQSGATISLLTGQSATCTITNDDNEIRSDLGVSIGATPTTVKAGDIVTYTVTVVNNGPDAAPATLTHAVPSTMTFRSISGGSASCTTPATGASGTIICNWSGLASGTSAVLQVHLQVGPVKKASITNTVSVAPSGTATDPVTANNTAAITVRAK